MYFRYIKWIILGDLDVNAQGFLRFVLSFTLLDMTQLIKCKMGVFLYHLLNIC